MYQVLVDRNLKANISYPDPSFPVGVFCDDYSLLMNHTLNCHWHRDVEISLVQEGAVDFYLNGTHFPLCEGECLFINSGVLHTAQLQEGTAGAVLLTITFLPELFSKEYTGSGFLHYFESKTEGLRWDSRTPEGAESIALLREVKALEAGAYGYELRCLSLLCRIWLYIAERIRDQAAETARFALHDAQMKRILSYIHGHFREKITVEELARHAGLSRSQCFVCFKQYTGVSPVTYVNDYRLMKAAALAADSDCNVTEIGYACGFADASYFIRLFREKFGVTPLQYRRSFPAPSGGSYPYS